MLYQYGYWQGVVQIGVCLMSKCGEVWGSAKPKQRTTAKVGRNDPCPCGSGKKYKNCCGRNA